MVHVQLASADCQAACKHNGIAIWQGALASSTCAPLHDGVLQYLQQQGGTTKHASGEAFHCFKRCAAAHSCCCTAALAATGQAPASKAPRPLQPAPSCTHRRAAHVPRRDSSNHECLGGEGNEEGRAGGQDGPRNEAVAGGQPERHSVQNAAKVGHLRGRHVGEGS